MPGIGRGRAVEVRLATTADQIAAREIGKDTQVRFA